MTRLGLLSQCRCIFTVRVQQQQTRQGSAASKQDAAVSLQPPLDNLTFCLASFIVFAGVAAPGWQTHKQQTFDFGSQAQQQHPTLPASTDIRKGDHPMCTVLSSRTPSTYTLHSLTVSNLSMWAGPLNLCVILACRICFTRSEMPDSS